MTSALSALPTKSWKESRYERSRPAAVDRQQQLPCRPAPPCGSPKNRASSARRGWRRTSTSAAVCCPALEREALALIMKEHGVDVATAVDVGSILYQRAQGADLYVVGGWRYPPDLKFFAAKHLTDLRQLRGARVGIREPGDLGQLFISNGLRKVGIDPRTEIELVLTPVFLYRNDPTHLDRLRSGQVDAMTSQPPYTDVLQEEGFPLLLDPLVVYPGGRPASHRRHRHARSSSAPTTWPPSFAPSPGLSGSCAT